MSKINVCCVKEGDKYDSDYVNTLYLMTKRYLTIPFDFICLTENSQNLLKQIKVISLDDRSIKGWWNKCLLFKPGLLSSSCLYLDLDMIIIKNIDEFIIKNQYLNILCNPLTLNNKIYHKINSSMMFWNAENKELHKIWFRYSENKYFLDCRLFFFPNVIILSILGFNSLAFGNVVVICSYLISELIIFLNRAFLCSEVLFNFL